MHTYQLSLRSPLTVIALAATLAACGGTEIHTPESSPVAPISSEAPLAIADVPAVAAADVPAAGAASVSVAKSSGDTAVAPSAYPMTSSAAASQYPMRPATLTNTGITDIVVQSTSATAQTNVPLTFGQVFVAGHVPSGTTLAGKLADGSTVPFQVDVKARHADGSVRHAIISAKLPQVAALTSQQISIVKAETTATTATAGTPAALLAAGFSATAKINLGGVAYTASVAEQLAAGNYKTWLSGSVVNEYLVAVPLKTAAGVQHPHLTARFAIRAVQGSAQARVDVTIENNWAYEPAPQNFTYDAQIEVGGATVYTKPALAHVHHSRWRKVFWWGAQPQTHIKHNTDYMIMTKAVPNYDRSVVTSEAKLASIKAGWTGAKTEPMGYGLAYTGMAAGGGRPDIGIMPGWTVTYLLTMDSRAKDVTMGTSDLAGSWPAHYRDKKTDRPLSLVDYPYATVLGNRTDTKNPATGQYEAFPLCATTTACTSPGNPDSAHQPSFSYLPYIVSGDHYHLEELHFWTMWNAFSSNPHYRGFGKGLLYYGQVRSQAWSMRSLAQAAYITPDNDPLKAQFTTFLNNNLDWYNTNYTNSPTAPQLGFMHLGDYTISYNGGLGMSPWMDDFFTQSIGHVNELGFAKAKALLTWKARFPVARMTAPGACWIDGAIYSLNVRASTTSPLYKTMAEAYKASHTSTFNALGCNSTAMASSLGLKVGEMTGYSASVVGYPSNMQPALAYAAEVGGAEGVYAWGIFNARSVKPDYSNGPQFAIVPR